MVAGAADLFRGFAAPFARPQEQASPASSLTREAEMVALVNRRYDWSRRSKEPLMRTWATCLAFYVGDQYRRWDNKAKRLVEPQRLASYRAQIVDNQIPTICDTVGGKLAKARQMPRALPNTDDDEDRAAAIAGTRALEHWWRVAEMDHLELLANTQRILFGAAFLHDYWDPSKTAKVPVQDPMTGRQTAQRAPVGDFCVELKSVFDVFPEPTEYFSDSQWVIIACRKPLSWFEGTFGEKAKNVQADKGGASDLFDQLMPGNSTFGETRSDDQREDGSATLKVYYELPCAKYPEGRHMMTAGDTFLWGADKLPMPHGEIPVTMLPYRHVPKRLWPAGLIEGTLDLQRELNRAQNNKAENVRQHAFPKWFTPRGAKIDQYAITNASNEVIQYDGQQRPECVPPPSLPAWVENLEPNLKTSIMENAGIHDVTNGSAPAGVTAGVALQILQEQDDSRLSVPAHLGVQAWQRTSQHALTTIVERYREPRLLTVLGRGQEQNIFALMGADIGDRDVIVGMTEGLANTDSARRQRFFDYQAAGVFQMPMPQQVRFLSELNEQWLVDAIQEADQEMQAIAIQQQRQQAAQEGAIVQQQSAEAQGQQQQANDAMQAQALAAQQQQEQAQGAEQANAEAQRAHEMEMELLKQRGAMAQTQVQAKAQGQQRKAA